MGWRWRKGLRFGPLRVNLSKSGVGYSVGIPGYRVGTDAKGRRYQHLSIPGTGIYRRDYAPSAHQPGPQKSQSPAKAQQMFYWILLLALIWIVIKIFS